MGGGLGAVTTGGLNRGGDVGVCICVGNDSDTTTAGNSTSDSLDVVINVSFCDKFN